MENLNKNTTTLEEFIERSKIIYGDKYDYSSVIYINMSVEVKIICKIHGEFLRTPNNHLCGSGCRKCYKLENNLTTEKFIKQSREVHIDKDKYDYSLVEYVDYCENVKIICSIHGEFEQTPASHLAGKGCIKCAGVEKYNTEEFLQKIKNNGYWNDDYDYSKIKYIGRINKIIVIDTKFNTEHLMMPYNLMGLGHKCCIKNAVDKTQYLIKQLEKVHNGKYDYSKVEYANTNTKIKIICHIHGEFLQLPYSHLNGSGCDVCSEFKQSNTKEFIEKVARIHINENGELKYNYDFVEYVYANNKVIIFCPKEGHGKFLQTPHHHLLGNGCPKCKTSKGERKIINFLINNDISFNSQKTFTNCYSINVLKFDLYLPEYNLCIEYDGEQHFEPVRFAGCSIENATQAFENTKINDQIKNEYCKNNNISLLRIPYWDFKNIEEILEKELNIVCLKN